MGFEKPIDKDKSATEGFETDVVDLDSGSLDNVRTVKAPRRSARRDPRFGARRDRLGRREPNTDDDAENAELVAPVRPVKLSGQGSTHIQKPVMKEGSDFAYLFTDDDEDRGDRHMDRARASRLDGLAYDEKTDGDGEKYADLFEQPLKGIGSGGRERSDDRQDARPERPAGDPLPGFDDVPPQERAAQPQEAHVESERPPRRSGFKRRSRQSGSAEEAAQAADRREPQISEPPAGYDGRDPGYGWPGPDERDRYGYPDDRVGYSDERVGYPDERGGYPERYDRYNDGCDRRREYDERYDRPPYEDEYYDEYRRPRRRDDWREYVPEQPYPPYGYPQDYRQGYPAGYQPGPVYYPPAPVQSVPYMPPTVYGVPVQGVPYQGIPVQGGVPVVQGMPYPAVQGAYPAGGYGMVYDPMQQAMQQGQPAPDEKSETAAEAGQSAPEASPVQQENTPAQGQESAAPKPPAAPSSRFNRRGAAQEKPAAQYGPQQQRSDGPAQPTAAGGSQANDASAPGTEYDKTLPRTEGSHPGAGGSRPIAGGSPHFRPRGHSSVNEQPQAGGDASGSGAQDENRPAEPRFRRRHSDGN